MSHCLFRVRRHSECYSVLRMSALQNTEEAGAIAAASRRQFRVLLRLWKTSRCLHLLSLQHIHFSIVNTSSSGLHHTPRFTMLRSTTAAFIKDICAGDLKAVEARLKKKEKANQIHKDPKGAAAQYSLLHKAVDVGDLSIVCALLKAGADVDGLDSNQATALHWVSGSVRASDYKIAGAMWSLSLLCVVLSPVDTHGHFTWTTAELVKFKAKLNAVNGQNNTALHLSSSSGNSNIIKILLKSGADLNDQAPGYTPLHCAAIAGHQDALQLLLQNGADAEKKVLTWLVSLWHRVSLSPHGVIFLPLLCKSWNWPWAKPLPLKFIGLFQYFCCIYRVQDHQGCTPLMLLMKHGHFSLGQELLLTKAACDINAQVRTSKCA